MIVALAIAALAAIVILALGSGIPLLRTVMQSCSRFSQILQAYMAANWLTFGLGETLVAASGVIPASLIAVIAGANYGVVLGTVISATSTMLGGWTAFWLSRSMFRPLVERSIRKHPGFLRLNQGLASEGWRFVMLLRVSPVMPFALTSYGLGLTPISQRDFLLGTLASMPALIGYVTLGATGFQGLMLAGGGGDLWRLSMLLTGTLVVFYALWRIRRAVEPPDAG